jgi:hypothetical protein
VLNIRTLAVSSGSSGGGIYQYVGKNRYVTGVVSTSSWGSFINTTRFNAIKNWTRGNNSAVDRNITQYFNFGSGLSGGNGGSVNPTTNDIDRYSFHVNGSRTVRFDLVPQSGDADLYLYDVYGRLLGSSNAASGTDTVQRTIGQGIYYVEVNAYTASSYSLFRSTVGSAGPAAAGKTHMAANTRDRVAITARSRKWNALAARA